MPTIKQRWQSDWYQTPMGARVTMIVLAIAISLVCAQAMWENAKVSDWADVLAEPLAWFFLLGIFAVWPFRIATAVRKRGGNFTPWFVCAVIFNSIFVGIAFLLRYRLPQHHSGEAHAQQETNATTENHLSQTQARD